MLAPYRRADPHRAATKNAKELSRADQGEGRRMWEKSWVTNTAKESLRCSKSRKKTEEHGNNNISHENINKYGGEGVEVGGETTPSQQAKKPPNQLGMTRIYQHC